MSNEQIDIDTWNNRVRSVVMNLEKKIPKVGGLISFLTGIFWPKDKEDIWNLIKEQVEDLVDKKILEKELEERKEEIEALKDSMMQYSQAKNNERGSILSTMLSQSNMLFRKLTESSNAKHMIPLAIVAEQANLAILRERYTHGYELYSEDNSKVWANELEERYQEYKKYFVEIFPKWKDWREDQIKIDYGVTHHNSVLGDTYGKVNDNLTEKEIASFLYPNKTVGDYYKQTCEETKDREFKLLCGSMIGAISLVFDFNKFLANSDDLKSDIIEGMEKIELGQYKHQGSHNPYHGVDIIDTSGIVKAIHFDSQDTVSLMQIKYLNHDGNEVGKIDDMGRDDHYIEIDKEKHIIGFNFDFVYDKCANGYTMNLLCSMQIVFSDDTQTEVFGNRSSWQTYTLNATVDPNYALSKMSYKVGTRTGGWEGISVLVPEFTHKSLLEE